MQNYFWHFQGVEKGCIQNKWVQRDTEAAGNAVKNWTECLDAIQLTFTYLKSTVKTLEKGVKYVLS